MKYIHTEKEIEKIAIQQNKKGWGQLFLTTGKFIGKRPYPKKYWLQIDTWAAGFRYREALQNK